MCILYFDHFDPFMVSATHVAVDFVEKIALQINPSIATGSFTSNILVFVISF